MRASTVLFDTIATWRDTRARRDDRERLLSYGTRGTQTAFALEEALVALEGGYRAQLFPTGLAAIAMVFVAYLRSGDHVLVSDAVYWPVRKLCDDFLAANGIEFTYYAADGSDLEAKLKPNTRMVYAECPGSLVYEMIDPCPQRWSNLPARATSWSRHRQHLGLGLALQPVGARR